MNEKEFVDIICPEHDRTSCSDNNLNNGFNSGENYTRCLRCTFLQIIKDGRLPEDHYLFGHFEIKSRCRQMSE